MARAKVISQVTTRPNWYTVEDDLGVRNNVQSAVADYDYQPGREYSLFVPGGKYRPCSFRLLPYQTSKKWVNVGLLSKTHPSTAAALYIFGPKGKTQMPRAKIGVIKEVFADHLTFENGGCAIIPEELRQRDDGTELFQPGDCVSVIYGEPDAISSSACPPALNGNTPTVVGFGCDQEPRSTEVLDSEGQPAYTCDRLSEDFSYYYPAGVYEGLWEPTSEPYTDFQLSKVTTETDVIKNWQIQFFSGNATYAPGENSVLISGSGLKIHSEWLKTAYSGRQSLKPYGGQLATGSSISVYGDNAIWISGTLVFMTWIKLKASINKPVVCDGKTLIMDINLTGNITPVPSATTINGQTLWNHQGLNHLKLIFSGTERYYGGESLNKIGIYYLPDYGYLGNLLPRTGIKNYALSPTGLQHIVADLRRIYPMLFGHGSGVKYPNLLEVELACWAPYEIVATPLLGADPPVSAGTLDVGISELQLQHMNFYYE